MSGLALMGCLNDDNLIGENCYDEILNNGEELVDCGGPICDPCDDCENGVWDPLEGEQWVDCGGPCEPCGVHNNGNWDVDAGEIGIDCGCADCPSCAELCGDGLLNGNETIDNLLFRVTDEVKATRSETFDACCRVSKRNDILF